MSPHSSCIARASYFMASMSLKSAVSAQFDSRRAMKIEVETSSFASEVAAQPSSPSKRDEISLKKEEKMRKDKENINFQPSLQARRVANAPPKVTPAGSRFDRLYGDAVKRQEDEPRMKSRPDDGELTFTPSISPKARSVSRERNPADLSNNLYKAAGAGRVTVKETPKDSFKPTISKRAKSLERSSSVADLSARLYGSKDIYNEKLNARIAEEAERNAKKCTFVPKMSPKTRAVSLTAATAAKSAAVANRLFSLAEVKKGKLEEGRATQVKKEMEGVTFQPNLATKPKVTAAAPVPQPSARGRDLTVKVVTGSRFDHLYKDAIKRKTDDPLVRARVSESHMTFKPTISPKARSSSTERKPSELVDNLHNASGSGRTPVREAPADNNSYKPVITERARSLDRSAAGITDRLYACKETADEKLMNLKYAAAVKEYGECTFTPEITITAKNRVSQSDTSSVGSMQSTDTVQRLLEYGEEKKRKLYEEMRIRAEIDMSDVTFQPRLVSSPTARMESEDNGNGNGNQFDRLYSDAIKRKTDDPFVRAKVDESNNTFKPSISILASSIDRSTFRDINKRSKDAAEKKKAEELQRRASLAEFAHKPLLSRRASSLDRSSLELINARMKLVTDRKRDEVAARLARENTFAPKIPDYQFRSRSRSSSIDSASRNVSMSNATAASIAGRFNKNPPSPSVLRLEEERRIKAERDLALVKLKFAKAEKELLAAKTRSSSKPSTPLKMPSPAPSPTSRGHSSTPPAPPVRGQLMTPFSSSNSATKSVVLMGGSIKRSGSDVKLVQGTDMPFGRNV